LVRIVNCWTIYEELSVKTNLAYTKYPVKTLKIDEQVIGVSCNNMQSNVGWENEESNYSRKWKRSKGGVCTSL
jgi:hypothetical protein